jgi:hypothetical protein
MRVIMKGSHFLTGMVIIVLIGVCLLFWSISPSFEYWYLMAILVFIGIICLYFGLLLWPNAKKENGETGETDATDWAVRSPMYNIQAKETAQDEWKTTSKPTEWSAPAQKEQPASKKVTNVQTSPAKEAPQAQKDARTQFSGPEDRTKAQKRNSQSPPREHPLVKRAAEFDKAHEPNDQSKSRKKD